MDRTLSLSFKISFERKRELFSVSLVCSSVFIDQARLGP